MGYLASDVVKRKQNTKHNVSNKISFKVKQMKIDGILEQNMEFVPKLSYLFPISDNLPQKGCCSH